MAVERSRLAWVVLTMGDRWPQVIRAIESLHNSSPLDAVVLVLNGAPIDDVPTLPSGVRLIQSAENVGVPAGRALGVEALDGSVDYIGFLDDDAVLTGNEVGARIRRRFDENLDVAAVSMRLIDPAGGTARRHSPRVGRRGLDTAGPVPTFLGGASAVRASAYERVGGYWGDLFYSHEELELSWRLINDGFVVYYDPALVVEHPKTEISRHAQGWELTGRNRVMIARRNLPVLVMALHTSIWLGAGLYRAPGLACRWGYLRGWILGWQQQVDRSPMSWSAVRRLTALGRPPVI